MRWRVDVCRERCRAQHPAQVAECLRRLLVRAAHPVGNTDCPRRQRPGRDGWCSRVGRLCTGGIPRGCIAQDRPQVGVSSVHGDREKENAPDRLLSLSGVTLPIVSVLEAEGIHSVEQVAAADPVLLSIRTGFPFRFTLRLCSQAIVRRHFGSNASVLLPIGLADVVPIDLLMKATDGIASDNLPKIENPNAVIAEAAGRLFQIPIRGSGKPWRE